MARNIDIFMGLAVMCILVVMIIPVPPMLLDLLLSFNITLSIIVLLVGMYILKPLEFSAFPSILLLTTLFRLALNVATTRTILLRGSEGATAAGKVIEAFGGFVVGGNYVVGVIVFFILVVINFIVITKGSGRIAEVAARFTLDAMPGKQMSIDADLNAGLINEEQARERRRQIARESEYYGAMDGANKFVRGDAVAGIIITIVNIIAGLAIGVFQNNMSFLDASRAYTILTVGDGLVTQVPALIVSTAAGIVVSRAGTESSLGKEVSYQILLQPKAIAVAALIIFLIGLVPGLPTIPFTLLSLMAGGVAYVVLQTRKAAATQERDRTDQLAKVKAVEDIEEVPPVDLLGLEVGYGLIPLVDVEQNGELLDRIRSVRKQIAQELGLIFPSVHIQDNIHLKSGEYRIFLKGIEIGSGELMMNHFLAMSPDPSQFGIEGIPTKEPTYGLPAYWIKEGLKEEAMARGFTVVNPATVLTTHIAEVVRRHAHEFLGRQDVQKVLERIKETHPKVVEELVPNQLPLGVVVKVLQNLLQEQIPIRDMLTILESLADWAVVTKDPDILTEYVRQSMARTITQLYRNPQGHIHAITLDAGAEAKVVEALRHSDQGSYLALDPQTAHRIVNAVAAEIEKFIKLNLQPILLCSSQIRPHLKKMLERFVPNLVVLSFNDILSNTQLESIGNVELPNAN
jgi:flagellar biosynthesis protein FlhA